MNIDQREWDLQERAMRQDDAWRDVAQALRVSPGEPPADFAASVAMLAAAPAHAAATREASVERWLLRALSVALALSCIGALARYGDGWMAAMQAGFDAIVPLLGGASALNWVVAAGACMALSWAFMQGAPLRPRPRR